MEHESLNEKLFFLNTSFISRDRMFEAVSQVLVAEGYVSDAYIEKVIARENNHPTGFKLNTINVAMPHVDPEFIHKKGLFIVTSKEGILFKNAETDEDLLVHIVFGLLLNDADSHLNFLMKLAASFQDEICLQDLLNSQDSAEIQSILSTILN